jgi:hypothetical protein
LTLPTDTGLRESDLALPAAEPFWKLALITSRSWPSWIDIHDGQERSPVDDRFRVGSPHPPWAGYLQRNAPIGTFTYVNRAPPGSKRF